MKPISTVLTSLSVCPDSWWWRLFFSLARTFGGRFDKSFSACAFLFVYLFSFLSGDPFTYTNSTFSGQDQSTVAQRADTTVAECSLTSCPDNNHYNLLQEAYYCQRDHALPPFPRERKGRGGVLVVPFIQNESCR